MATYNGLLASLTKTGLIGVSFVRPFDGVPQKYFDGARFGVAVTQGVSGAFAVEVIGAIGGATFVIAGRTAITAVGSFPVPLVVYGLSGADPSIGMPRPYGVNFIGVTAAAVGFTASVFMAGKY